MRVLHLNNPAQVASNLVLAQRALGLDSNLVITGNKGLHDNYDHDLSDIDTNSVKGKLETGKRLYNLIKDCDILHYHGQAVSKGYRDLVMWAGIMNKPVILHHHGSEIRNKEYPGIANQLIKHCFVSTPDLLQFVPGAEWLPNPVDLDKIKYSKFYLICSLIYCDFIIYLSLGSLIEPLHFYRLPLNQVIQPYSLFLLCLLT